MKIIPYTKNWNEGETDWSYVEDPLAAISEWETANGTQLPEDYRRFMLQYNGGSVYPRLFKHGMGSLEAGPYLDESEVTYLDLLFCWADVEQHWRKETYGAGTPASHLIIGENPGGIQVLLSLDAGSFGKISTWYHTTSPWGSAENNRTFAIADSFTAFLNGLYDDEEKSDHDDWYLPIYGRLQKELTL